jgi:putative ABC transport system permease protein
MHVLRIIVRNLLHDKRRTLLTIVSVTGIVVLLALLLTARNTLDAAATDPQAQRILALRERSAAEGGRLPLSYADHLAEIDGVGAVLRWSYVSARIDPTHLTTGIAVDPLTLKVLMPPLLSSVSDAERTAFENERTAVLMGEEMMKRFSWKVGDKVTLQGGSVDADFPVTIAGVLRFPMLADNFLMHHDYLNLLAGDQAAVNAIFFSIPKAGDVQRVRQELADWVQGQPVQVEVITLYDFISEVVSRSGNLRNILVALITVVALAALLVVANNLAMAARERTRQIAILRSLGFRGRHVLWLILGEAGLIGFLGSALGGLGAYHMFHASGFSLRMGAQSFFTVGGLTVAQSVAAGLVLGLLAGVGPALAALHTDVTGTLRRVV